MPQPNGFVVQDVAGGGHADRLHMGNDHMVRSILQRQQLGDEAVFGVYVCFLRSYVRCGRISASNWTARSNSMEWPPSRVDEAH